jgi:hypothetical protein
VLRTSCCGIIDSLNDKLFISLLDPEIDRTAFTYGGDPMPHALRIARRFAALAQRWRAIEGLAFSALNAAANPAEAAVHA